MAESNADRDYGFTGRDVQEGNYSGAYGRGQAGETDAPSTGGGGGSLGAGYGAGGADLPRPDVEGGPVGADADAGRDVDVDGDLARGGDLAGDDLGVGGSGGTDVTPNVGGPNVM